MSFLSHLTTAILQNRDVELRDTLIVLPNKRARKMLQQEIALQMQQACFSPTIFSIDEFIQKLSPLRLANDIELLTLLHKTHQQLTPNDEKLSSFLSWATTFIHDISEIDMQMAKAADIFGNIFDIKELETTFGKEQLSENQQKYLKFYETLFPLYTQFNQQLDELKLGYEGKIYKGTAQNILDYALNFKFKRYIFAGFHTLSPSEMEIIRYYYQEHHAELYFDVDEFYFDKFCPFVKDIQKILKIKELNWISNDFTSSEKDIKIVGASQAINQILYAIEELQRIEAKEGNLNNTVLAFADEALITPFLHCYNTNKANLTMGYPLSATPSYALLSAIMSATRNGQRFQQLQQLQNMPYYHRDVLGFYRNPLIVNHVFNDSEKHDAFLAKLIASNSIFFQHNSLIYNDFNLPDLNGLPLSVMQRILQFFKDFQSKYLNPEQDQFDYYCTTILIDKLTQTCNYLQSFPEKNIDLESAYLILNTLIQQVSIPLKGNPNEGLQIMGLLETRTLDFKHVIVLSVNEGTLPAGKSTNSLILFDVKKYFNLPTYKEKDSVYGYHFLRLLQRAETVTLLYNTDSTKSLAEKSRFIKQVEFEVKQQKIDNIHLHEITLPTSVNTSKHSNAISISKDENMLQALYNKTYSFSHLANFINCPLQFYFKHVANIEAADEISENIEQNIIGDAIHHIMEQVGKALNDKPFNYKNIIEEQLAQLDTLCRNAMTNAISSAQKSKDAHAIPLNVNLDQGKMFLALNVVQKSIKEYLTHLSEDMTYFLQDKNNNLFKYTEEELIHYLEVEGHKLKLKGFADRIDYRNGHITILDYKTGYVDDKGLSYSEFHDIFTDPKHNKLLQLLMYGYLYHNAEPQVKNTDAPAEKHCFLKSSEYACGIISFQKLYKKQPCEIYPTFNHPDKSIDKNLITKDILQEFEQELQLLLSQIINPNEAFTQTDDASHCRYCDYRAICKKQNDQSIN